MVGGRRQHQDTHTRYICILWLLLLLRSRLATFHCCWPLIRRGRGIKTATVAATTTTTIVLNEEKADKWSWQRLLRPFLALFKLLLQIKRAAKEATQKSQDSSLFIKRLTRRFPSPLFSFLISSLSFSLTNRQPEMFPNYFSYNLICILLSQVANLEFLFRQLLLASQTS